MSAWRIFTIATRCLIAAGCLITVRREWYRRQHASAGWVCDRQCLFFANLSKRAGAKNVPKTCQIIHSDIRSREPVFHPQENALAVEARPGDHSHLYPFDHFQSDGPIRSAMLSGRFSGFADLQFCRMLCRFRQFNN